MNFKLFYILIIIFFLSCNPSLEELKINDKVIYVEIADTDESRALGLMNRNILEEDRGMLFVFEEERQVSFWMKNTLIPLSVAYINKEGVILEIYDMFPKSLEPVTSKRSSIKFALEVNKGFFDKNNIRIGDKMIYLKSSK